VLNLWPSPVSTNCDGYIRQRHPNCDSTDLASVQLAGIEMLHGDADLFRNYSAYFAVNFQNGLDMRTLTEGFEKTTGPVPENYDEYYLQIVKASLRYACPIAAAAYFVFFPLDLISGGSSVAIKTLALRGSVSLVMLAFWRYAPVISSVRVLTWSAASLYLLVLLNMLWLISVLSFLPNNIIVGQASLLLVTMCACGMFFLRPIPLAIVGAIGLIGDIRACLSAGLTPLLTTIIVVEFGLGIIISCAFMVLLEKELRRKYSLERSLQAAKEKSEILLQAILPRYVIERIEKGATYIADAVPEVDIIFIDIVGFSTMSKKLGPQHLIEILGEIFRSFDDNCERYDVTKIKTIGDSYMAATNLPDPTKLSGVRAVEFCQEALLSVEHVAKQHGIPISVRIGVATGGVIAGVLSLRRPAYDLWGETVNLASRMESTGEPGRIQISERTYWAIKHRFGCEHRDVDVDGSHVETYFVS
jgi:adenylate cyclase